MTSHAYYEPSNYANNRTLNRNHVAMWLSRKKNFCYDTTGFVQTLKLSLGISNSITVIDCDLFRAAQHEMGHQ